MSDMEAQAKKRRKTRNEMVNEIIMESVATEQNVISIQKHFAESVLSTPQSNRPFSEIVHSSHDADEIHSLSSESSGEEIIQCTKMEQTLQYMKEAINEDNSVTPMGSCEAESFSRLEPNYDIEDSSSYHDTSRNDVLLSNENDVDEENDWVLDYLDKIQEALQEEMDNITKDVNEVDDEEVWYDSLDEISNFQTQQGTVDNDYEENADSKPLYENAPITVGVSALLIMTFAIRHMISGKALHDLLVLVSLHCGWPNYCFKTLYTFKKYFQNLKSPLKFHNYCSKCNVSISKEMPTCPNSLCLQDLTVPGNMSFFIEISIEDQIRSLFAKTGIWNLLNYRFSRVKRGINNIEDIYDGKQYRRFFGNGGILDDQRNISLTWNTDGIPVFKSSKVAIWPLYFVVNELPYAQRISRSNMIVAGLWFGSSKPNMLTYLKPFHSSLKKLETNGIRVENPEQGSFVSRAILLAGTCDLPAKCMVCNSIQFNGQYGCLKCKQAGETFRTEKGGIVHSYPFKQDNPKGPERTHEETLEHAKQAVTDGKPCNGIKGPSWLAGLKHYDIIKGTGIDYMHAVLLGVMKLLLNLWFGTNRNFPFSISHKINQVDKRLLSIRPPDCISRCPRSIEAHRKYFKASELRSFLLFYGPAILLTILPTEYYDHFLLLSEAIYVLLQQSITVDEIAHAERLLFHFCVMFETLYGKRYQTANIHCLVHLADNVRELGPLWTHSCFHFEDKNGFLLKTIHGTQQIHFQLISAISISKRIPELEKDFLLDGTHECEFYHKLTGKVKLAKNEVQLSTECFAIGGASWRQLSPVEFDMFSKTFGSVPPNMKVQTFSRIRKAKCIYHSKMYKRVQSRNSYTIRFADQDNESGYGLIEYFAQFKPVCLCVEVECKCPSFNFAVVSTLSKINMSLIDDDITHATVPNIIVVAPTEPNKIQIIDIAKIQNKCTYMEFCDSPHHVFLAQFPNSVETD
ncbi:uncharacterized protein LOC114530409 [Dendronephthya gigantea]|uniref:uncharacterized protein LOC114530409 n=1 Tax=Dendronephthya gigantea TaxID=151771 RepID=UPI00106D5394|nr:uncharacterized protein LOC114530409 [Dendronephthya gigantea]